MTDVICFLVSLAKPYIAKLARIANVEEAVQVLLDMEKSNIPLHSRAFQHFFAVTCRLSSIYKKEAYFTLASIFDRFRERNLVTHEPATIYSMMVTRACELLDFERAESYYSGMDFTELHLFIYEYNYRNGSIEVTT